MSELNRRTIKCAAMKHDAEGEAGPADYVDQLNRTDFRAFLEWVNILAVHMRLAEFETRISPQSCTAGYVAEVDTDFNYHRIQVALCPQFHTFPAEKKRSILVHELLHAHMTCLKMPYEALEDVLAPDVYSVTTNTALRMEEHVVTSLEAALAESMPLPPQPGKRQRRKRRRKS